MLLKYKGVFIVMEDLFSNDAESERLYTSHFSDVGLYAIVQVELISPTVKVSDLIKRLAKKALLDPHICYCIM